MSFTDSTNDLESAPAKVRSALQAVGLSHTGKNGSSLSGDSADGICLTKRQASSPEFGKKKSILKKSDGLLHREETEKLISDHTGGVSAGILEVPIGPFPGAAAATSNKNDDLASLFGPVTAGALVGSGMLGGVVSCVAANQTLKGPLKAIGPKTGTKPHALPIKFAGIVDDNVACRRTASAKVAEVRPHAHSPNGESPWASPCHRSAVDSNPFHENNLEKHTKDEGVVENKAKDLEFRWKPHQEACTVKAANVATAGVDSDANSASLRCTNTACPFNEAAVTDGQSRVCPCGQPMVPTTSNKNAPSPPQPSNHHQQQQLISQFNEQNVLKSCQDKVLFDSVASPTEVTKLLDKDPAGPGPDQKNTITRQSSKESLALS